MTKASGALNPGSNPGGRVFESIPRNALRYCSSCLHPVCSSLLRTDFSDAKTESFGMRIVDMLTGQLDGTMKLDRKGGTKFTLKFPVDEK